MQPSREAHRRTEQIVLRLLVRNHPGLMSHVCGLFARRAFNLEAILCVSAGDGTRSVMLLRVLEDDRLEQLLRQLRKLEDVIAIERDPQADVAFAAIERSLGGACDQPGTPA